MAWLQFAKQQCNTSSYKFLTYSFVFLPHYCFSFDFHHSNCAKQKKGKQMRQDHKKEEIIWIWCPSPTYSFFFLFGKGDKFFNGSQHGTKLFQVLLKTGVDFFDKLAIANLHYLELIIGYKYPFGNQMKNVVDALPPRWI
jgi:hypothetical protein